MPAEYQRLPTTPPDDADTDSNDEASDGETKVVQEQPPVRRPDVRFEQPAPSPWKRVALVLLIFFLFWLAIVLRKSSNWSSQPKIVHATRYSKEYKFRPAASPIVTERLKNGKVRVRGAQPSV